jgi:hypothetical protein
MLRGRRRERDGVGSRGFLTGRRNLPEREGLREGGGGYSGAKWNAISTVLSGE